MTEATGIVRVEDELKAAVTSAAKAGVVALAGDTVLILAVVHTARQWPAIM